MQPEALNPTRETFGPSDAHPLGNPPTPDRLDRHVVRDLASSVLGYAELLGEGTELDERGRRYLEHILEAAKLLLQQTERHEALLFDRRREV